jgi:polysaccharide biosynthesis/export protein
LRLIPLILCASLALGACTTKGANLPAGAQAYQLMPAPAAVNAPGAYRLGPMDQLTLTVLQEPELSGKELPVDPAGNLSVGLIGAVRAEGRTAEELSDEIEARLRERYLVDPRVSVAVTRSVSQRVTVDGAVEKPGSYEILGQTTLLQAIAEAQGASDISNLKEVYVFRRVDGQRYGAKFDVGLIRIGEAEDPKLLGGDVVVVGSSGLRGLYRDFLQAAPLLGTVFLALIQR